MKKNNIGSSLDSLLREEGIYEEVTATAIKRVLARQVEAAMQEKQFTKAEMARKMHTSRAALDRLLDPDYDAVTLSTLRKAAVAVVREIRIELVKIENPFLDWIAKGALSVWKRKIELLEAEMKAPGRECAYVFNARKRFGGS